MTCAPTAGDTAGRSPHAPVTPERIAAAAGKAGAAIVRDCETGQGARAPGLFRSAGIIRDSGTDAVPNLTAAAGGHRRVGLGANLYLGRGEPATNALAEKADRFLDALGCGETGPAEAGDVLGPKTFH